MKTLKHFLKFEVLNYLYFTNEENGKHWKKSFKKFSYLYIFKNVLRYYLNLRYTIRSSNLIHRLPVMQVKQTQYLLNKVFQTYSK